MDSNKSESFIYKLAAFIVDKRNLIFLLYTFAFIFCIFSMNWVKVENDVTVYLPEDTETRQGLVAMNENFSSTGSAQVMVSNISLETAQNLAEELAKIEEYEKEIGQLKTELSATDYKIIKCSEASLLGEELPYNFLT